MVTKITNGGRFYRFAPIFTINDKIVKHITIIAVDVDMTAVFWFSNTIALASMKQQRITAVMTVAAVPSGMSAVRPQTGKQRNYRLSRNLGSTELYLCKT